MPSTVATTSLATTPAVTQPERTPDPCIVVIFGASGDLTKRKLLPALYHLEQAGLLPEKIAVVGVARRPLEHSFAADMKEAIIAGGGVEHLDPKPAAETTPDGCRTWVRTIIETPFGHDLESAKALNDEVNKVFDEDQIFRIDHYLGKETVQNILVFRFANGIFEPLWNRRYIDHVQITVGETVGVEDRGAYYDTAGALRDMVPNHLFQLVALIGMEPPSSLDADAIRDEQVKVFRSIRPYSLDDVSQLVVRGQYDKGMINGKPVPAYREEPKVPRDSHTETLAALKLEINNWRWADVPFYLRTGKRLARRHTEIVIQFRRAPHLLFRNTAIAACQPNQLVVNVQPEEGISLRFGAKVPGPVVQLGAVTMDFDYAQKFGNRPSTGYERLLYDCMIGDQTLFRRADMSELGWAIVEPILQSWEKQGNEGLME